MHYTKGINLVLSRGPRVRLTHKHCESVGTYSLHKISIELFHVVAKRKLGCEILDFLRGDIQAVKALVYSGNIHPSGVVDEVVKRPSGYLADLLCCVLGREINNLSMG